MFITLESWTMTFIQAICVFFGLFMLYVVRIHRRKNHLEAFEFGMWFAIWIGFIFLSIFPQTINGVAQDLHVARVFDFLVVVGFMILSYIALMNRISFHELDKKLEEIIRKRAIDEKK
ncbi:hypothetical protein C5B42_05000 [Candidatus Cerribacteria bacterium 'Amazon FNV 2010 28 9']|uniref:DUF2304 domain-containing protein n=1 Tax=Candidatus Cerribacteria bacterium 'Amazon FNV 2010 28 9' TaxID=2081795 RepID=A0A317JN58_9BACT|nr:MAG: hypothetical protein C5B42_05000 [Candidatus Cerribacteria bacterium 'Amazon FNV 2010 28 9']